MPGTRAQTKSRGGGAGATSVSAVGNFQTADPPESMSAVEVTRNSGQGEMSVTVLIDINDPQIVLLRAGVTNARKDLDDISAEIADQVGLINTAVGRATPKDALMRYKKALKDLIEDGDVKLTLFNDKNGKIVEKLEALVLTASENTELFTRATSLRDKFVGESIPYRGRFRKLMAEHEALLTGVWGTGTASTSVAPALLPRVRKEYDFLKPNMVHSDCTKRELLKFVTDRSIQKVFRPNIFLPKILLIKNYFCSKFFF